MAVDVVLVPVEGLPLGILDLIENLGIADVLGLEGLDTLSAGDVVLEIVHSAVAPDVTEKVKHEASSFYHAPKRGRFAGDTESTEFLCF
jgi:hypothetical protein